MNCTGTLPISGSGVPCKRIDSASRKPNSRQANIAGTGFHLAKISAASAMKPLPAVMSFTKPAFWASAR